MSWSALSTLSANSVTLNRGVGNSRNKTPLKWRPPQSEKHRTDNPSPKRPYIPLQPRIEHFAQPRLPWNESEINDLRLFELFWDDRTIGMLVDGTNKYAAFKEKEQHDKMREKEDRWQNRGQVVIPGVKRWRKVVPDEMQVFLGLLVYMGSQREGRILRFWQEVRRQPLGRAISLKRFYQIKRHIHISDPEVQLTRNKWFRGLGPLNSIIRDRCQEYYLPASNITVDEMMIWFGGRSHHTYRMPSKPIREGYKVFALCDIGYTFNWLFASRSQSVAELKVWLHSPSFSGLLYSDTRISPCTVLY